MEPLLPKTPVRKQLTRDLRFQAQTLHSTGSLVATIAFRLNITRRRLNTPVTTDLRLKIDVPEPLVFYLYVS